MTAVTLEEFTKLQNCCDLIVKDIFKDYLSKSRDLYRVIYINLAPYNCTQDTKGIHCYLGNVQTIFWDIQVKYEFNYNKDDPKNIKVSKEIKKPGSCVPEHEVYKFGIK